MSRGHDSGQPRKRQEPLYDPETPAPSHAEYARTLVAGQRAGTLCTVATEPAGYPYGSLVSYAVSDGAPVFFVSTLATHTKNLQADGKASLMVSEALSGGNPLALGRVTLVGDCAELSGDDRARARAAFLEAHPESSFYIDFKDFGFWRLNVTSLRYIGGFGRMSWVEPDAWGAAGPDPIAPHSAGIISHMNEDHADAMEAYCLAFSRAEQVSEVSMTGIDRYGFELSAMTPNGRRPIRVGFDEPITSPSEARAALVALVRRARETLNARNDS